MVGALSGFAPLPELCQARGLSVIRCSSPKGADSMQQVQLQFQVKLLSVSIVTLCMALPSLRSEPESSTSSTARFLATAYYDREEQLLACLDDRVIAPAAHKAAFNFEAKGKKLDEVSADVTWA